MRGSQEDFRMNKEKIDGTINKSKTFLDDGTKKIFERKETNLDERRELLK